MLEISLMESFLCLGNFSFRSLATFTSPKSTTMPLMFTCLSKISKTTEDISPLISWKLGPTPSRLIRHPFAATLVTFSQKHSLSIRKLRSRLASSMMEVLKNCQASRMTIKGLQSSRLILNQEDISCSPRSTTTASWRKTST